MASSNEKDDIIEAPRTVAAKQEPNKIKRLLKVLGPGLITGASDDDPSGIITYAQAGAQYGLAPLWTALFTFPLMSAIQYICSKIALATGCGLTSVMQKNYPPWLLYVLVFTLVIANTINAGADIGAIAAGIHLIVPAIPPLYFVIPITLLIVSVLVLGSYNAIVSIFKWLTLALFAYIFSAVMTQPNWGEVFRYTFIPHIEFTSDYLALLVAILGTTISPYLFFWQSQSEVEEYKHCGKRLEKGATKDDLKYAAVDVNAGMLLSNVVMFFIVLGSAQTLHAHGVKEVMAADQAASALKPVAGEFASYLFASGLIGTGILAVPVLVGCSAYCLATVFGWKRGLSEKWYRAREFYAVIAVASLLGMALNFLNFNPMSMLFWTAVLNGLLSPPLLVMIMLISNNKKIMGDHTNSLLVNVLGWLATIVMTVAAMALLVSNLQGK